jgi:exonuclease VII small subunit
MNKPRAAHVGCRHTPHKRLPSVSRCRKQATGSECGPHTFHRFIVCASQDDNVFTRVLNPDNLEGARLADISLHGAATQLAKEQGQSTVDAAINARLRLAGTPTGPGIEHALEKNRSLTLRVNKLEKEKVDADQAILSLEDTVQTKKEKIKTLTVTNAALKKLNKTSTGDNGKKAEAAVNRLKPELKALKVELTAQINASTKEIAKTIAADRDKPDAVTTVQTIRRDEPESNTAWMRKLVETGQTQLAKANDNLTMH